MSEVPGTCPICERHVDGDELDNLKNPVDPFQLLFDEYGWLEEYNIQKS